MTYHTIISSMLVKPEKEPIFSELATTVELVDEAAGPFVKISQHSRDGGGAVSIEIDEWPYIRETIDRMMLIAGEISHD